MRGSIAAKKTGRGSSKFIVYRLQERCEITIPDDGTDISE